MVLMTRYLGKQIARCYRKLDSTASVAFAVTCISLDDGCQIVNLSTSPLSRLFRFASSICLLVCLPVYLPVPL